MQSDAICPDNSKLAKKELNNHCLKAFVLRKLKTPKMQQHFTVRTASDRKRFAKIASMVLAGIENRIFIPQRSWMCSDCAYTEACSKW